MFYYYTRIWLVKCFRGVSGLKIRTKLIRVFLPLIQENIFNGFF